MLKSGEMMSVFLLFLAALICVATYFSLRSTAPIGAPITYCGFDGVSVLFGFVTFTLAAAPLGTAFGFDILASLMLHELGHVLAYRMLGHSETRFRLVPLLTKLLISDQPLKTESEAFFVALMGPAFSLAPMTLAAALSVTLASSMPECLIQNSTHDYNALQFYA